MSDDETFEESLSGAQDCTPSQAGKLKKGDVMIMKGFPCKIMDSRHFKTGKHGSGKNAFVGIDVFTGKKVEFAAPSAGMVEQPVIISEKYTLADIKVVKDEDKKTKKEITGCCCSVLDKDFNEKTDFVTTFDEDQVKTLLEFKENQDCEVILNIQTWRDQIRIADIKKE